MGIEENRRGGIDDKFEKIKQALWWTPYVNILEKI